MEETELYRSLHSVLGRDASWSTVHMQLHILWIDPIFRRSVDWASRDIDNAVQWSITPQRHAYWESVNNAFRNQAPIVEPKPRYAKVYG
jgi:hypothetical protein